MPHTPLIETVGSAYGKKSRETETNQTKPMKTNTNFVNVTPHAITIVDEGGFKMEIPPSGIVARVSEEKEPLAYLSADGCCVSVSTTKLGDVTGLPEVKPNTWVIASRMVADAVSRGDVLCPGELLRDDSGVVVGCKGLVSLDYQLFLDHLITEMDGSKLPPAPFWLEPKQIAKVLAGGGELRRPDNKTMFSAAGVDLDAINKELQIAAQQDSVESE